MTTFGKTSRFTFCGLIMAGSLLLLISGCATTPSTRFYVLSPMPDMREGLKAADALSDLVLGVGPVRVAGFLDRPQIVRRTSENQLEVGEFDRWGGNLSDDFGLVVAENLSQLLGTESVVYYPWQPVVRPHMQVALDIRRLDQQADGMLRLTVLWKLFADDGRQVLRLARSDIAQLVENASYEALVKAASSALGQLSREIAAEVRHHSGRLAREK